MKFIPLTRGKTARVDVGMIPVLKKWAWNFSGHYACRGERKGGKYRTIFLHRFVFETTKGKIPVGKFIDHINGDKLDCRIKNLRLCTRTQNGGNRKVNSNSSTGFKGVFFSKQAKKYVVRIGLQGKRGYGGYFENINDAAIRYNQLAQSLYGKFSRQNHVTGESNVQI